MTCETPEINTAGARHDNSHKEWKKMTIATKTIGKAGLALAGLFISVTAVAADLEVSIEGLRSPGYLNGLASRLVSNLRAE